VAAGAIYLDAENFWLTPEERDVINEAPDYRASFGAALGFAMPWRYVVGNTGARVSFPPSSRISRDVSYLTYILGPLMYHELAHANDFSPPSTRGSFVPTEVLLDSALPRLQNRQLPSDAVTDTFPLQSAEMRSLSQVSFQGVTATEAQKALTPTEVAAYFSSDRASDQYAYSTTREDIAMLFEEFMMSYRQGVRRDVAVTGPITSTTTGSNLIVAWGQRGRIADPGVAPRAKLAIEKLAPWVNSSALNGLPAPLQMRAGSSWTSNLVLPEPKRSTASFAVTPGYAQLLANQSPESQLQKLWQREADDRARGHEVQLRLLKRLGVTSSR
jgi:hypothetical protein